MAFARFDRDGRLDNTFNNSGFQTVGMTLAPNIGASVVLQSNGGIVGAAGTAADSSGFTYLARLNGTFGSLDSDFGRDGVKVTDLASGGADFATGLALQADGKFVIVGNAVAGASNAFVARFDTNALLDRTFGDGGIAALISGTQGTRFQAVALDADGRILATGFRTGSPNELILLRFWP
jgi:uncharacterized delta-60 repeat protein